MSTIDSFFKRLPPRWIKILAIITFTLLSFCIAYAIYTDRPVEIFGIIKVGKTTKELKNEISNLKEEKTTLSQRLDQSVPIVDYKELEEKYHNELETQNNRNKELTSRNKELNSQLIKIKHTLEEAEKERDNLKDQISELEKEKKATFEALKLIDKEIKKGIAADNLKKKKALAKSWYYQVDELLKMKVSSDMFESTGYLREVNEVIVRMKAVFPKDPFLLTLQQCTGSLIDFGNNNKRAKKKLTSIKEHLHNYYDLDVEQKN